MKEIESFIAQVQMVVHINDIIDVSELLGLSVKYDAKERIQVNSTAVDSLSSLHLRPGDIIRYFSVNSSREKG